MSWLGIDIGGANLKAADGRGWARSVPFALWRQPKMLAETLGALVESGPADRAGIMAKDVVVAIDGKPTRDTPALLARIAELAPGSTSKVSLWRDRKVVDVVVTVGKRPRVQ